MKLMKGYNYESQKIQKDEPMVSEWFTSIWMRSLANECMETHWKGRTDQSAWSTKTLFTFIVTFSSIIESLQHNQHQGIEPTHEKRFKGKHSEPSFSRSQSI